MVSNLKDRINMRCIKLTDLSEKAESKMKNLPDGRIVIKRQNKYVSYYKVGLDTGNKEKYLDKSETKLIGDLIQKNYLEKILLISNNELKYLKEVLNHYPQTLPEDIYSQLSPDRQAFITPIILTDEQFVERWQNSQYTHKPISKDAPVYETMKGERVRSKSEMIIADRLKANNIPYKYECPIKAGVRIIHPDFTILRVSDRKILYLEHCGKVGDQEYGDDMVDRINDYAQEGIVIGDRLFITCESENKPFDVRVLDEMIEKVFR